MMSLSTIIAEFGVNVLHLLEHREAEIPLAALATEEHCKGGTELVMVLVSGDEAGAGTAAVGF